MNAQRKTELLKQLVAMLKAERGTTAGEIVQADDPWLQFRALVNTRPPWPATPEFLELQDELLQGMIAEVGIHRIDEAHASPAGARLRLWRGDITTLAVDTIVNAANAQMLGCWAPLHYCIDNTIHTFAGVQLRIECDRIMSEQGHDEPTGTAKITPAYNLPSKHIIHTVGPIANGQPTSEHRAQLASCYESCLNLACENGLGSIAFCCISTGVFSFPQQEAAQIAVDTVRTWLDANPNAKMDVVFNVFGKEDEDIYRHILGLEHGNL